jgi:hypothetical protein
LEKFPTEGLKLEHCGLLFLSTPHSGTGAGNWNDTLLLLAKAAGVARGQVFTQLLGVFNQASVNAQEQFGALDPVPPIECLYETQKTSVVGTGRIVSGQRFTSQITSQQHLLPSAPAAHITYNNRREKGGRERGVGMEQNSGAIS